MRDFSKVSPLIWRDKRFRSLASSDARLAMLYFVTCEHQNSAGCYRLPDAYAAADLGWDIDRFVIARQAVDAAGLVLFDNDTSELFIAGWFEMNPVANDKHAIGCDRLIGKLESDIIREAAKIDFEASEVLRRNGRTTNNPLSSTRFMNGSR